MTNATGGHAEERPAVGPVVAWGVAFALWVSAVRMLALLLLADLPAAVVVAVLMALPGQLLLGSLLGAMIVGARSVLLAVVGRMLLLATLVVDAAAVYYETVFSRLPSAGVLFYLRDLDELGPSMTGSAPLMLLTTEVVLGGLLLELLRRRCADRGGLRLSTRGAVSLLAASLVLTAAAPLLARASVSVHQSRTRTPLLWLAESALRRHELRLDHASVGPQSVLWLQHVMGHSKPFAAALSPAPLCGAGNRGPDLTIEPPPSVIMVVLESVATSELNASHEGRPVMPNLLDFAHRHILLPDIKAAGTKSGSVMPPLFCGLPPQTHGHLLHRLPLNSFDGFPALLAERGYRTAYLHGADLTWEFQRSFLKMVGFDELYERDPRESTPTFGWGYSDEEMLARLQQWLEARRETAPAAPFFTALFTLSSHDPYDLPPQWTRIFDHKDTRSRHLESLAYLDHHLGEFLRWYEAVEEPLGTVLVMVGDHAPHLLNTVPSAHGPVYRFEVPMIISAPHREQLYQQDYSERRGAHHDLPATLMSLLGLAPLACDQGIDLLMDEDRWPENRIVYSVGGEDLEEIQLWTGEQHILLDRLFRGVRWLAPASGSKAPLPDRLRRFLEILLPLNQHLMEADAYTLPAARDVAPAGPPLPRVGRPLVVSHRGNTGGEVTAAENSLAAVGAAAAAGFDAVEVDLQLTRDLVPVLHHDPTFNDAEGHQRRLLSMDLEELRNSTAPAPLNSLEQLLVSFPSLPLVLETKPQADFSEQLALGEAVAELVRGEAGRRRVIVDSFSLVQATATAPSCECEVGWDLPFGREVSDELLRAALLAGVQWIFVEHSVLEAEHVAAAHRLGLRVMAYTINQPADLERLLPELPDGVITDNAQLLVDLGEVAER